MNFDKYYIKHPKLNGLDRLLNFDTNDAIVGLCSNYLYKSSFLKNGRYGFCPEKNKYGIITKTGGWDDINRLNTNYTLHEYYMTIILYKHDDFFDDFLKNPYSNDEKINAAEKLFKYLDENYELFFTKRITNEFYYSTYSILRDIWNTGNITTLVCLLSLKYFYSDVISHFIYDFKTGNQEDMEGGVDFKIVYKNGVTKLIQAKTLTEYYQFPSNRYVHFTINSGLTRKYDNNIDLCASKYDEKNNKTSFLFVKNDITYLNYKNYSVKTKDVIKMERYDNETVKLIYDIQKFCMENNIILDIVKNGTNDLTYIDGTLTIDFEDIMDNQLFENFSTKFEKIKSEI